MLGGSIAARRGAKKRAACGTRREARGPNSVSFRPLSQADTNASTYSVGQCGVWEATLPPLRSAGEVAAVCTASAAVSPCKDDAYLLLEPHRAPVTCDALINTFGLDCNANATMVSHNIKLKEAFLHDGGTLSTWPSDGMLQHLQYKYVCPISCKFCPSQPTKVPTAAAGPSS